MRSVIHRAPPFHLALALVLSAWQALLLPGCADPPPPTMVQPPAIATIEAPRPLVEGSPIHVRGTRFENLGPAPVLQVSGAFGRATLPLLDEPAPDELVFEATAALVDPLAGGTHTLEAFLDGAFDSAARAFDAQVARELPIRLDEAASGDAYRNELFLIRGDGFLAPSEGSVSAHFEGTFTAEGGGAPTPVLATLPVEQADRFDRERGVVRLTTALGGLLPGAFDGTITLESRTRTGTLTRSTALALALRFLPPLLVGIDPPQASLEQVIRVSGAGFLGGPDEPDELTLIRVTGTFTPEGGEAVPASQELVLEWVSGAEVRGVIRSTRRGDSLVSELFGAARGVLEGTAVPVVGNGAVEVEGAPAPFRLELVGMRQIVRLVFLPGFYGSLERFGLGEARGRIEGLVEARVEDIYARWGIDVRLDPVEDFSPNGYAQVEIGGPDPNGVGLFGYDNTPGKDVGNLRLYDAIGGANAETQGDGYPGYGGVFVESMLYFSAHPELPGRTPPGAPQPDPLFDEIFDPTRRRPATSGELAGEGPAARVAQVQRALEALASMVGETTAHELGHSLGLAEPYGPSTVFHNVFDEEGCLMDTGGSRPLGERTAQEGYAISRLCHDAPRYLDRLFSIVD